MTPVFAHIQPKVPHYSLRENLLTDLFIMYVVLSRVRRTKQSLSGDLGEILMSLFKRVLDGVLL